MMIRWCMYRTYAVPSIPTDNLLRSRKRVKTAAVPTDRVTRNRGARTVGDSAPTKPPAGAKAVAPKLPARNAAAKGSRGGQSRGGKSRGGKSRGGKAH